MNVAAQFSPNPSLAEHPFVARLSRLVKLSALDLSNLERIVEGERLVKKRQDLVVVGHEYRNLCLVSDGYAIRYKLLRSGKRQILNVILPGDVIGFPVSFFDHSIYSVVAVSDLTYNACSLESYVRLCYEHPQFGLVLSWLAAHEAAIYAEHIVDLGRRTPVERLAHFLLETHTRLLSVGRAEATGFNLPFSQEVMADVLALEGAASQSRDAAIARRWIDRQPLRVSWNSPTWRACRRLPSISRSSWHRFRCPPKAPSPGSQKFSRGPSTAFPTNRS